MTELFAGATSYWLVLAKSGGSAAGAAGGTCCPGGDGGGRCLLGCVSWVGRSSSGGSRCSAAPRLRALGRFGDAGWQDLRAVRDSRGPCSESGPFMARSSRGVFPNSCLQGFSNTWRAYLARASPFSDAWRANLAANWRFSRPRPLSGCMERKTCHGLPPRNAPRRNLATARHSRTHRARILPLPVARERIREDLAMDERLDSPAPNNCRPPRKKTAPKAGLGERPRQKHERQSSGAAGMSSGGTARCSAIAEHSGMQRGEISSWPITRPETKEGEHFARLLLLFCLRLEWPSGAFAVGSRRHLAVSLIEAHIW